MHPGDKKGDTKIPYDGLPALAPEFLASVRKGLKISAKRFKNKQYRRQAKNLEPGPMPTAFLRIEGGIPTGHSRLTRTGKRKLEKGTEEK
jgi:hypothetical protein